MINDQQAAGDMAPDNIHTGLSAVSTGYSTTRLLTREPPVIEEPPDAAFQTVLTLPEGKGRQGEGGLRTQGYYKRSLPAACRINR